LRWELWELYGDFGFKFFLPLLPESEPIHLCWAMCRIQLLERLLCRTWAWNLLELTGGDPYRDKGRRTSPAFAYYHRHF
jgi:hypothetical protein